MQTTFTVSFDKEPLPPVQILPNGKVVNASLTHPETLLGLFFSAHIQANLSQKTDLLFIGRKDISIIENNFRQFVQKHFSMVAVNCSALDLIVSLWQKSRSIIDNKLKIEGNIANIEKERSLVALAVQAETALLIEGYKGKMFTPRQGEFIIDTLRGIEQKGAEIAKAKTI